jgi:hypothetical protein
MTTVGWAIACVLAAGVQDAETDKIGKDKPPVVARKFLQELQKRKGAAIKEVAVYSVGPNRREHTFEGVMKKDVSAVAGSAEIYAKGAKMLIHTGGRFDPPEALDAEGDNPGLTFKNPCLILDELQRVAASATFGGDEVVDGKDCRVVDFVADPATLRQALRDLGDRLSKTLGRRTDVGGVQVIDFKTVWDEKASLASYRVCVGVADLRVYRAEFVLRPKMKPGAVPGPFRFPEDFGQRWDVFFTQWDEELPMNIPGPVKAKLAIR